MEINPFEKSLIKPLEYDTDDEESYDNIRVIYKWQYEQNFDYFKLLFSEIYLNKNVDYNNFNNMLIEIQKIRLISHSLETGDVIKIENSINLKTDDLVYLYLLVYYDNTKCNFIYYGVSNQLLEEEILIENIRKEKKYGKKGCIKYTDCEITTLDENDFIIFCLKKYII